MKKTVASAFVLASVFLAPLAGIAAAEGESANAQQVSEKLDLVLQKLDEIKAELEIVKVRATNR